MAEYATLAALPAAPLRDRALGSQYGQLLLQGTDLLAQLLVFAGDTLQPAQRIVERLLLLGLPPLESL
ncbi:hypothetical protein QHL1GM_18810 [Halomonas sp. QHL1]|nr:hypothetical protein QHL1GM_18810 [Halomonas sp. QHL1]